MTYGNLFTVRDAGIAAGSTVLPFKLTDAKMISPNGIISSISVHPNKQNNKF